MFDVMSVRLHLSGVRVLGVLVDSVDRLEVEVESAREWSRCPHCGFRCYRVWDRRPKRVRDLEVSGRRTTLVWRRRRFECSDCGERHLEGRAQFQGGLSRRFARRLVQDARVMSIRAVARHHGVGWHRIMGLVRAHSAVVAERRRARPTRVLLVDETSIRRRHRYVTVVACGDSGKVLAMIPGRTNRVSEQVLPGSGSLVVPGSGDNRLRWVPLISGRHRSVSARCPPCARPLPRGPVVHQKVSRWYGGRYNAAIRISGPQHTSRTCSEPALRCCAGRIISQTPTGRTSIVCSTRIPGCEPRGTLSKSSTRSIKPKTSTGPTRRWDGSLISTTADRSPNTTRSWTPSSPGEKKYSPTTAADEHRTDRWKGSTTSSRSYDESLTGSPTTTTTQPEESS